MQKTTNQNSGKESENDETMDFLPEPLNGQMKEATLLLMEEALEERSKKTRRVKNIAVPASQERRKADRRQSDGPQNDV